MSTVKSLVLLDRDGVINRDRPQGVSDLREFIILPQALEVIALLKGAGGDFALVLTGKGTSFPLSSVFEWPVFNNLYETAQWLIAKK